MSHPADHDEKKQLYNRQEYVVGAETQLKYGVTDVLVVGATGLAAEVIKNLSLTGVRSIRILDDTPITLKDLGTNFFFTPEDVGRPRASVAATAAAELNRFVEVTAVSGSALDHIPHVHVAIFTNQLTTTLQAENAAARAHGVKFVACESRGISCALFVDGGESFFIADADGEETVSCVVTAASGDGLVTLHEDKMHNCEVGSRVYFTGIVAPEEVNSPVASAGAGSFGSPTVAAMQTPEAERRYFTVAAVVTPYILRLGDDFISTLAGLKEANVGTSTYLHTTKKTSTISFKGLATSVTAPDFVEMFDVEKKFGAPSTLHALYAAMHAAERRSGATPSTPAELAQVRAAAKTQCPDLDEELAALVLATYQGDLNPMACFAGGLAAQEALKLCSGKFTPAQQWLYYDVRELCEAAGAVVGGDGSLSSTAAAASRYAGQTAVLGEAFQKHLAQTGIFIVGAGALGCELIKNAALMGIGSVSITDMDSIEMSNLSRQFLFRNHHIGQSKSLVAGAAAKAINSELTVHAFKDKMGPETEGVFNEAFWGKHAAIVNALDNVESRKYVDGRCLFYKKPLFESGTLGTKCNVQCVIPYLTESYSNSSDPPERSIPLCTLKNFPNAIEHTIQWARDHFHLLFYSIPADVNQYLHDRPAFEAVLQRDPAGAPTVLKNVRDALARWPTSAADCVAVARRLYNEYFSESLKQLLHNIPIDKRNEDGMLFWSGAKKPPKPQEFDATSDLDVGFVYHCAHLLAEVYGLPPFRLSPQEVATIAAETSVPAFQPREVAFAMNEADKQDTAARQLAGDLHLGDLPDASAFAGRSMHAQEFEKDDPTNHHVEFITYCSNLRAVAYSIPPADITHTKRIAGRIIPAMVTTTSLVTGLVGIEMLKYLLLQFRRAGGDGGASALPPAAEDAARELALYRNAFVNIALPFAAFSQPIEATTQVYAKPSGGTLRWGVWDRLDVNENRDVSVNEIVDILAKRYDLDIFMITLTSGKMLFTAFGGKAKDKTRPVSEIAVERGEPLKEGDDYLNLIATGMIGEEDVDVPVIRYKFRNF